MARSDMNEIAMIWADFSNVCIVHTYALVEPANLFNTSPEPETFEMNTTYGEYHLSFQPLLQFLICEKYEIFPNNTKTN
jgi:hypothetical protein